MQEESSLNLENDSGVVARWLAWIHVKLFGQDISAYMRHFLRQLSYSFVGLMIANLLLFAAIMLVGRQLGPEQFGWFSLTVAISQVLIIPMMLGMDVASMRGVSLSQNDRKVMRRVASSGLRVVGVSGLVVAGVVLVGAGQIGGRFGLDISLLRWSAVLAVAIVIKTFLDSVIRGEGQFRLQALVRVLEAAAILLGWLWLWRVAGMETYGGFVLALLIGSGLASLLYLSLGRVGNLLSWQAYDSREAWALWQYIRFALIGAVGALLLMTGDKILVEKMMGAANLGVYAAYYFVSVQVAVQVSAIFVNVFFPMVASQNDKQVVLKKLNRLVMWMFIPGVGLTMAITSLSLKLLSGEYTFDFKLVVAMSVFAMMFFIWQTYWWFIASTGAAGVRFTAVHGVVAGGAFWFLLWQLVGRLGLFAPAVSFMFVFAYISVAIWRWSRNYQVVN